MVIQLIMTSLLCEKLLFSCESSVLLERGLHFEFKYKLKTGRAKLHEQRNHTGSLSLFQERNPVISRKKFTREKGEI